MTQDKAVRTQTGVMRTNCMDNLDRTNVVQAALAKWTLSQQLKAIGVMSDSEELDDFEALTRGFRESKAVAPVLPLYTHYAIQCGPIMRT
jgi:hypothetical protein